MYFDLARQHAYICDLYICPCVPDREREYTSFAYWPWRQSCALAFNYVHVCVLCIHLVLIHRSLCVSVRNDDMISSRVIYI